jgi:thiamine kinase-like enzyme
LREGRTLDELAAALRRLHALPVVGRRFDPCAAARRYASHLGTTAAADLAHRAATLIDPVPPPTATGALCHNDLVAENVLRTPERGLVLIDWEYSGIGDPYFDLAVVIRHHGLGDAPEGHLLACYLQREPREAERRHLRRQCDFYGVLLDLWNLRVGNL